MAIININVLKDPGDEEHFRQARQAEVQYIAVLIAEHRRGEHVPGMMQRDCPMCRTLK